MCVVTIECVCARCDHCACVCVVTIVCVYVCAGEREAQENGQHGGHETLCQDIAGHELPRHQVRRAQDNERHAGGRRGGGGEGHYTFPL